MTPAPLVLTPEEETALLILLGGLPINGADRGPVARPMIKLLWRLEQRDACREIVAGETVH